MFLLMFLTMEKTLHLEATSLEVLLATRLPEDRAVAILLVERELEEARRCFSVPTMWLRSKCLLPRLTVLM
jgi:hypothetical protein